MDLIIQMDAQGRIVLPKDKRGKGIKYYACQTEKDGSIHLLPLVGVITQKQAYFWTKRWQKGEQEASEDLKAGRYKTLDPKKLDDYLNSL